MVLDCFPLPTCNMACMCHQIWHNFSVLKQYSVMLFAHQPLHEQNAEFPLLQKPWGHSVATARLVPYAWSLCKQAQAAPSADPQHCRDMEQQCWVLTGRKAVAVAFVSAVRHNRWRVELHLQIRHYP